MPLRLQIDPGGEKYFAFARRKLEHMKRFMRQSGLKVQSKHFFISTAEHIWIKSLHVGFDTFLDFIRITSGASGLFEVVDVSELVVLRDLVANPYTDEEQAIVDQADADLAARIITLDEYNDIIAGLNETLIVDPTLLDPGATNYGFVLPNRVLLGDATFDVSKLLNDSFKRQHPTEYGNLDYYIHGFDFSGAAINNLPGQRFVYLPAVAGGTLVVVNPAQAIGTAAANITEATSMLWVAGMSRKRQSVAFGAAQGADPDFVINWAKQPSQSGSFTGAFGVVPSVSRRGNVVIGLQTTQETSVARVIEAGAGYQDRITTIFGSGFFAASIATFERDSVYLLATAAKTGSLSVISLKRYTAGANPEVTELVSVTAVAADSGVVPILLRASPNGFVALFYAVDIAGTGLRTMYFLSGSGLVTLYEAAYNANGGARLDWLHGDISSAGVAACAHLGPGIGAEPFGHYLVVKIDGAAVYRESISTDIASATHQRLSSSLSARWTPDGRYFIVVVATNSARVFDADGAIVYSGAGGFSFSPWAVTVLSNGASVDPETGIVTRRYLWRAEVAGGVDQPFARQSLITVTEDAPISVAWGVSEDRPRIWDASVGGGVWETSVELD